MNRLDQASGKLIMQKYSQLLTTNMFFRLGNEIRKIREEEDRKITEKYAEMEAKYQAQKLPKLRRGKDAQRCQEEEAKRRAVEEQRAREAQEDRRMAEEEKRKGEKEN